MLAFSLLSKLTLSYLFEFSIISISILSLSLLLFLLLMLISSNLLSLFFNSLSLLLDILISSCFVLGNKLFKLLIFFLSKILKIVFI